MFSPPPIAHHQRSVGSRRVSAHCSSVYKLSYVPVLPSGKKRDKHARDINRGPAIPVGTDNSLRPPGWSQITQGDVDIHVALHGVNNLLHHFDRPICHRRNAAGWDQYLDSINNARLSGTNHFDKGQVCRVLTHLAQTYYRDHPSPCLAEGRQRTAVVFGQSGAVMSLAGTTLRPPPIAAQVCAHI